MKGNYYDNFVAEAEKFVSMPVDFGKIPSHEQYIDYDISKQRLSHVLQESLENLDKLLITFDNNWNSDNGKKFWFTNYNDLLRNLRTLVWEKNIKTYLVDNPESYLWTEVGLDMFLKKENVKKATNKADIQFFEVNKLIADSTHLFILGNADTLNRINNGSINVFITGIEQVFKNTNDLELYVNVLKDSAKAHNKYFFPILYTPTAKNHDNLYIMDNMRSNVLNISPQRSALACMHCGLCSDVCPVQGFAGADAYDNIFSGPFANVVLPFLENVEDYGFVSSACTLCGNCEKVCPVSIPLRHLILQNRHYLFEKNKMSFSEKKQIKQIGKQLSSRSKMNKMSLLKKLAFRRMMSKKARRNRKYQAFAKNSFNQQYLKNLKEKYK